MSTQNSFRLVLLFAALTGLCQLGLAQDLETSFAYSASNAANNMYELEVDSHEETKLSTAPKSSAFDFSQGVSLPYFDKLEDYVSQHLIYPDLAESYGIEGTVVLSLKLSSTGKVIEATVEKSLGYGCDEAALALVTSMPQWTPAQNYGTAVGAKQLITIDFTLR